MARARRFKNRTPFRQSLKLARGLKRRAQALKQRARALKHWARALKHLAWPRRRHTQAALPSWVNDVNGCDYMKSIIVHNHYLFTEALRLSVKTLFLYLPEYLTTFYRCS